MLRTRRVVAMLCCALAGPAAAHDSWLARGESGEWRLLTGSRYPVADAGSVPVKPSCRTSGQATACWSEVGEHVIELEPRLVDVYLREIRPPEEQLRAWAAMKADGLPWQETYRKFARVETGEAPPDALRELRRPFGLPLEVVVEGDRPLRAGESMSFRVLAHGAPAQGFAVELVSERSTFGVWQRTDADGRLRHVLPFGGKWVLRGTLLERDGTAWRSRFVTLAFDAK